ncbi:hypothetical protein DAPPUDRAFT_99184 [Daphnia pulex]|uniref:Uncharacterized protein n=1 Tax=Daphnia pulex TaxID=6669 RepID=E9G5X9_DAPPU|nr:hypothetical protein DAPPUDRAFT_99184 [Daphnia pulex]|eukprot:EFX84841.1 hypothetical protein DAPPUDRAFT_99184 [Daphnia pulex]
MEKLTLQHNGKFVQLAQLSRYAFANARNESCPEEYEKHGKIKEEELEPQRKGGGGVTSLHTSANARGQQVIATPQEENTETKWQNGRKTFVQLNHVGKEIDENDREAAGGADYNNKRTFPSKADHQNGARDLDKKGSSRFLQSRGYSIENNNKRWASSKLFFPMMASMVTDHISYGGYCIHEYEWTATEEVNEPHESPTSLKDTLLLSVSPVIRPATST